MRGRTCGKRPIRRALAETLHARQPIPFKSCLTLPPFAPIECPGWKGTGTCAKASRSNQSLTREADSFGSNLPDRHVKLLRTCPCRPITFKEAGREMIDLAGESTAGVSRRVESREGRPPSNGWLSCQSTGGGLLAASG